MEIAKITTKQITEYEEQKCMCNGITHLEISICVKPSFILSKTDIDSLMSHLPPDSGEKTEF